MSPPRDTTAVRAHWNRLVRIYDRREMERSSLLTARIVSNSARHGVLLVVLLGLGWSGAAPVRAAPAASTSQGIHVVAPGDTLWSIAARHDTSVEAIAGANRLRSIHRLQVGDQLNLAPRTAISMAHRSITERHVVLGGETLWAIAQRHGTSTQILVRINGLADESRLRVGQPLELPGRTPAVRPAPPPTVAVPRSAVLPALRPGFGWPSRGVLTSRFGIRGRRHHHGVDIAGPVGTPITAARDGVVIFAGWTGGYGRLVVLDHGAGLATWYGHASTFITRVGQRVQRGQLIARVGRTGHVTGPNLHFEVRRNNLPLDPLLFLREGAR